MAATSISIPPKPLPLDLPNHNEGFKPDDSVEHQLHSIAQHFLSTLERACVDGDGRLFQSLFVDNGFWRDVLAFTNDFRAIRTANVAHAANAVFPRVQARNFVFAKTNPALDTPYPDTTFLMIHFEFETKLGNCYGVARLIWDGSIKQWRAFTLFTLLEGIKGHEPKLGRLRPRGSHNDPVAYDDKRTKEQAFEEGDPDVLVVGGGHNGLAIAAQLKTMGVRALVVDKQERTGDNWRKRYRSLSLHDPVFACHLPFLPFPSPWPLFTPAGKLANFLESYAEMLEINVWLRSTVIPSETVWNEGKGRWEVTVAKGDVTGKVENRRMSVKHIVCAMGFSGGRPKMPPPFPGQKEWDGVARHSSAHGTGADWKGKKALVVGACTSGHDISVDFTTNGADVTMLQRSPTFIMSVENGQNMMLGGLYGDGGPPLDVADRIAESSPKAVAKLFHQRFVKDLSVQDKELLDGLAAKGFKTWSGPDSSGFLMMAFSKGGGYYFSTGGSEMVANGDIKVRQGEIESFKPGSIVRFKDGSEERFDVVVFATGYTGFPDAIRETVGEQYLKQCKPIWGFDEEGEVSGICRETNIPNLFFLVGALAPSRFMSKVLALQIVAQQNGLFEERYTYARQEDEGGITESGKFMSGRLTGQGDRLPNGFH